MTIVAEQTGTLLTQWVHSCWSCLSLEQEILVQEPFQDKNIERDMEVCYAEPHLVPPMNIGSHQSRKSLSFWVDEGRQLKSRASRPSISLSRKASKVPLTISAPSDFRHVQSFHDSQPLVEMYQPLDISPISPVKSPVKSFHEPQPLIPTYQPLELSIHHSGGKLSDLPSFESFQLGEELQTPRAPPPALSRNGTQARRCVSMAAGFSVHRKPVGSEKIRSLSNVETVYQPHKPRITSVYIPHFSVINLNEAIPFEEPTADTSSVTSKPSLEIQRPDYAINTPERLSEETVPRTPERNANDKVEPAGSPFFAKSPSSSVSSRMLSQTCSPRCPPLTPSENRNTIAEIPVANCLAQWSFQGQTAPPRAVSLTLESELFWDRTRTLSGTTVASDLTTHTSDAHDLKTVLFTEKSLDDLKHQVVHEERSQNPPLSSAWSYHAGNRNSTIGLVF